MDVSADGEDSDERQTIGRVRTQSERSPAPAHRSPSGRSPSTSIVKDGNQCACCETDRPPMEHGQIRWREGKFDWRLTASVAYGRWLHRVFDGDVRLCQTCVKALPPQLRKLIMEVVCAMPERTAAPFGPPESFRTPHLRQILQRFVQDWKQHGATVLCRHLSRLPVYEGVALATAPLGQIVKVLTLTGEGFSGREIGGDATLVKCSKADATITVKWIIEHGGREQTIGHGKLVRQAEATAPLFVDLVPTNDRPATRSVAIASEQGPSRDHLLAQAARAERDEEHARASTAETVVAAAEAALDEATVQLEHNATRLSYLEDRSRVAKLQEDIAELRQQGRLLRDPPNTSRAPLLYCVACADEPCDGP